MKYIGKILFRIILLLIILFLVTRVFKKADDKIILSPPETPYSRGNAPDSVRRAIIKQLSKFQEGYSKRDPNNIDSFMQSLYSKNNILILGTQPKEVYRDYEAAARLIQSDWESWGDCRFNIDSANISSFGNTAWFSTKGYVKFDLTSLLVAPLRLTGVMIKEDQSWKFQQQQFQFDNDISFSLLAALVIMVWILISIIKLCISIVKLNKSNATFHINNQ